MAKEKFTGVIINVTPKGNVRTLSFYVMEQSKPVVGAVVKVTISGNPATQLELTTNDEGRARTDYPVPAGRGKVTVKATSKTSTGDVMREKVLEFEGQDTATQAKPSVQDKPKGAPTFQRMKFIYEITEISEGRHRLHMHLIHPDSKAPLAGEIFFSGPVAFRIVNEGVPKTATLEEKFSMSISERGEIRIIELDVPGTHKLDVTIVSDPNEDANIKVTGPLEKPIKADENSSFLELAFDEMR